MIVRPPADGPAAWNKCPSDITRDSGMERGYASMRWPLNLPVPEPASAPVGSKTENR